MITKREMAISIMQHLFVTFCFLNKLKVDQTFLDEVKQVAEAIIDASQENNVNS